MNFEMPKKKEELKCECGCEAVGSPGHSEWCPKHDSKQCKHSKWIWCDDGKKQCLQCADFLEE